MAGSGRRFPSRCAQGVPSAWREAVDDHRGNPIDHARSVACGHEHSGQAGRRPERVSAVVPRTWSSSAWVTTTSPRRDEMVTGTISCSRPLPMEASVRPCDGTEHPLPRG